MTKLKPLDSSKPRLCFYGLTEPRFFTGVNCTIRAGRRWFDVFHTDRKSSVVILNTYGRPVGTGTLHSVYYLPLMELKPEWLVMNAQADQRTLSGVYEYLRKTYSECPKTGRRSTVEPSTYVSVVFFTKD